MRCFVFNMWTFFVHIRCSLFFFYFKMHFYCGVIKGLHINLNFCTHLFLLLRFQGDGYQSASALLHGWRGRRATLHLLPARRQRHHVLFWRPGPPRGRQGVLPGQRRRPLPPVAGPEPRAPDQWERQCSRAVCQLEPVLHPLSYRAQQPPQRSYQLWQHRLCLDCHLPGEKSAKLGSIEAASRPFHGTRTLQYIQQSFHRQQHLRWVDKYKKLISN